MISRESVRDFGKKALPTLRIDWLQHSMELEISVEIEALDIAVSKTIKHDELLTIPNDPAKFQELLLNMSQRAIEEASKKLKEPT